MREIGYPKEAQDAQHGEHALFVKQVENVLANFKSSTTSASNELFTFLANWLLQHVAQTDKKIGIFYAAEIANGDQCSAAKRKPVNPQLAGKVWITPVYGSLSAAFADRLASGGPFNCGPLSERAHRRPVAVPHRPAGRGIPLSSRALARSTP